MPTESDIAHYERLMTHGLCSCGHKADEHANTIEEQRRLPFHCVLLKDDIMKWHTPRKLGQQGAGA